MSKTDIEALFLAHGRELRVFLLRQLRDPQIAADLLQETFLRLAEQPALAGIDNPRSYLYRTARNLAIDHFRQEERRQTRAMPHESMIDVPDGQPALDEAADSRERMSYLRAALDELPARTREIFLLNRRRDDLRGGRPQDRRLRQHCAEASRPRPSPCHAPYAAA